MSKNKKVACVTFSALKDNAKKVMSNEWGGWQYEIIDVKTLISNPLVLYKYLVRKYEKVIGLIESINSAVAIDLIGSVIFLKFTSERIIYDLEDNKLNIGLKNGILFFLYVLRDSLVFPFALLLSISRSRSIYTNAISRRRGKRNNCNCKRCLYLRTDTFGDLQAGGSVGHTVGVLKGLKSLQYDPVYYSPYIIKSVQELSIRKTMIKKSTLLRNVPELPLVVYSEVLYRNLRKRIETQSHAFIYQRYSLNNYSGLLLSWEKKVPFILEYNGSDVWIARNWGTPLFFEPMSDRIELANLRAADLIVVVSDQMKDELIGRGIDENKILVNPNGVDPDTYSPDVDGSSIRMKYGLEGKVVVGFIGTFGKWHGADVLANAFGKLMRKYPEYRDLVRLLMIGDGMTMPTVKENLAGHGVEDISILSGLVPQEVGPSHMAACDILVASHVPNPDGTPFFGSPTKLFEYMAMGKGIVASDLDQIGEVLEHENTGWLVKPGDAESLMQGLKVLIDDQFLRKRLGRAARKEVVEKYTWKEHTRKIIEALKDKSKDEETD